MEEKIRNHPPGFIELTTPKGNRGIPIGSSKASAIANLFGGKGLSTTPTPSVEDLDQRNDGVVQKQLNNGMRVSMKTLDSEPQRVSMRLLVPGKYFLVVIKLPTL